MEIHGCPERNLSKGNPIVIDGTSNGKFTNDTTDSTVTLKTFTNKIEDK
jgi:hypothetical protein